jgi:hypothetical protein
LFRIADGRSCFWQWDTNRRLIVEDASITQVHFCNKTDDCSLVCETFVEDGLTLVNVPNILLQTDWRINVYAYDSEYTKHAAFYDVKRRSKPADYVYTETEVINYENLLERMAQVEENVGDLIEDYLEENPIKLDGYATEEYVTDAIAAIPAPDYTGLATEKYVDDAIEAIPEPDLSGYALKEEVPSIEGLASESYVNEKVNDYSVKGYHFTSETTLTEEELEIIRGLAASHSLEIPVTIDGDLVVTYVENHSTSILIQFVVLKHLKTKTVGNNSYPYCGLITYMVRASGTTIEKLNNTPSLGSCEILVDSTNAIPEGVNYPYLNYVLEYYQTNMATKSYVDTAVQNGGGGGTVDLTNYATKQYVQEQIEAIPDPDLSGFQTADDVAAAINTALAAIGVAEEGAY